MRLPMRHQKRPSARQVAHVFFPLAHISWFGPHGSSKWKRIDWEVGRITFHDTHSSYRLVARYTTADHQYVPFLTGCLHVP